MGYIGCVFIWGFKFNPLCHHHYQVLEWGRELRCKLVNHVNALSHMHKRTNSHISLLWRTKLLHLVVLHFLVNIWLMRKRGRITFLSTLSYNLILNKYDIIVSLSLVIILIILFYVQAFLVYLLMILFFNHIYQLGITAFQRTWESCSSRRWAWRP